MSDCANCRTNAATRLRVVTFGWGDPVRKVQLSLCSACDMELGKDANGMWNDLIQAGVAIE